MYSSSDVGGFNLSDVSVGGGSMRAATHPVKAPATNLNIFKHKTRKP